MKVGKGRSQRGKATHDGDESRNVEEVEGKVIHGGDESRNVEKAEEKSHSWR
ncbi:hypothetical protein JCM9140_4155 [Halalkalibacter wakoensis JCM 9140]|uniref:Uncharacterized protein n=1 Tax=Halalkalibacter wakoensis JCM 9140 TaxID=1236970 RepID=W4Q7L5_9BACI|nr:hypothetical protein JCM9140_4155 [Halalkalibacter wakoensis JCM 9140]